MTIPKAFIDLLSSALSVEKNFPPTLIFNEGWMLRILLESHQKGNACFPIPYNSDSSWFSEGIISTPFNRKPYRESGTRSDGVIGQIKIRENTKAGLRLTEEARQFVVIEAKMKSGLSPDIENADFYDQASRYLACMCKTIELSNCRFSEIDSLGFYIIAPEHLVDELNCQKYLDSKYILKTVAKRVNQYRQEKEIYPELRRWYDKKFKPFMALMEKEKRMGCLTWESVIKNIPDDYERMRTREFLDKCYEHM